MKIYMVTVSDKAAETIEIATGHGADIFIGDYARKYPVEEINLYVDVNDD